MAVREEVLQLLNRVDWPEGFRPQPPPSIEELRSFSNRHRVTLPPELLDWLKVVNGAPIGPGGVFGVQDAYPYCSMDLCMRDQPHWRDHQWLPVAADGCGNYYMLVPEAGAHHVYFIDAIRGYDSLDFACSSDLWTFLWFLFRYDLEETKWPFDRDEVLKYDPCIVNCKLAPLPWDAE